MDCQTGSLKKGEYHHEEISAAFFHPQTRHHQYTLSHCPSSHARRRCRPGRRRHRRTPCHQQGEAAQTSGSSTEQAASGRTQATTEDVTRIGIDKAKQIAVSHAGIALSEAAFQKAKLEKDNGRTEYEIEFYHEGIEYDYTVDAASGKILEYDIDRDD